MKRGCIESAFIVLFFFSFLFCSNLALADTVISGAISSSTVWSPTGGVYVIDSSFSVAAGVTLTIEPGTIVKGNGGGYNQPSIYGKIIAIGTKELPIYFTSFGDDSVGGDTNGDGPSVGERAQWQGLYFKPSSEGNFDYANISYAGIGGYGSGDYVGIENDGGIVNIKHSNIHDNFMITSNGAGGGMSVGNGILNKSGTLEISDSIIDNNVLGIRVDSGTTTVSNTIIKNNIDSTGYSNGYGIYASGIEPLTLLKNTFFGNKRTVFVDASKSFTHSGNISDDQTNKGFEMGGIISKDTTFTGGDLLYIVQELTIQKDKTLTLEPGTILKMSDYYSSGAMYVQSGNLIAKGTPENKIYITSLKDDSVGGDTNGDDKSSTPAPKNWASIFLENGSKAEFDNVVLRYGGYNWNGEYLNIAATIYQRGATFSATNSTFEHNSTTAIFQDAGTTNITKSELIDGNYVIWSRGGNIAISQSNLARNTGLGIYNESGPSIDARNNWWGDLTGPHDVSTSTPTGTGTQVSANVLYKPWLMELPGVVASCCSNVLFLPGLEASRLYLYENGSENQLWEPNRNLDVEKLYLNMDGTSKNSNIYTRDIIGETNTPIPTGALGQNIYKSFSEKMNQLVADQKITEWKAFPYDWRMSVSEVIEKPVNIGNGQTIDLIAELKVLIKSSKNDKVTIIVHSNGGLLAKALLVKLQEMKIANSSDDMIDHVDLLILVASPQIGTAGALPAMLHGFDQSILLGWLMNETHARELGRNMPGGYGLLPSKEYINRVSASPVTFADNPTPSGVTTSFVNAYGNVIVSYDKYKDFLFGKEGRTQQSIYDTLLPINLLSQLFTEAETLHNKIDEWTPPASLKVVEVAGWGLDTLASFQYYPKWICDNTDTTKIFATCRYILDEKPIFTVDGDKTVVESSAHYMNGADAEKVWVNLPAHNRELNRLRRNREHKDILEVDQLNNFILSLIKKEEIVYNNVLTDTKPIDTSTHLRINIHSPVSIGAYDKNTNPNFTGKVCSLISDFCYKQEDIPNSSYMEFGEGKYVNLPEDSLQKIVLQGTDIGTFTYESEKVLPTGEVTLTTFIDIAVTTQTKAEVTLNTTTQVPELALDVTGDGTIDFIIAPKVEFDPILFLQIMRKTIESFDISKQQKNTLIKRIDDTIKAIQKGKINKSKLKIEQFRKALTIHPKENEKDRQERERKNEQEHEKEHGENKKPKQLAPSDVQILLTMLNQLLDNLNK